MKTIPASCLLMEIPRQLSAAAEKVRPDSIDRTNPGGVRKWLLPLAWVVGGLLHAQPLYVMKDLGVPANVDSVEPTALNERSQVAGNLRLLGDELRYDAFVYSHGRSKVLPRLGKLINRATGINEMGVVVGYAGADDQLSSHAILYKDGRIHELETLGGGDARAYAINCYGEIAGYSWLSPRSEGFRAVVWSRRTIKNLGTLGGLYSIAYAMNDAGQVAGVSSTDDGPSRAFLFSNGAMHDLGTLGGPRSTASGVNIWGQVTGYAELSSDRFHAFLYSDGVMTDLGTLVPGKNSMGQAINRWGQVVGQCVPVGMELPDPAIYHAFLFSGQLYDLNDLVLDARGWVLTHAVAINDSGQIAALGTHPSSPRTRGFLLTPVPDKAMRHTSG